MKSTIDYRYRISTRKKAILLSVSFIFFGTQLFNQAFCQESNQSQKLETKTEITEVKPTFPIGNKVSRGIQKYTGINFLTGYITSKVVGHTIKKRVGGKVKVKVKTFSLTDLIAGKVKSIDIKMNNSKFEEVPVSGIRISTKAPAWFSRKRKNRSHLNTPVVLNVQGQVQQKDLTAALASENLLSKMKGLKLELFGLGEQQLDVLKPRVKIEDDKFNIEGTLITKGGAPDTGVPFKITGTPELINKQKIVITNLKVESDCIVEPETFAKFVSKLINPIVDFGRYDRTTQAFRLSSFDIANQKVSGIGELILVPPKPTPKSKKKISEKNQSMQRKPTPVIGKSN